MKQQPSGHVLVLASLRFCVGFCACSGDVGVDSETDLLSLREPAFQTCEAGFVQGGDLFTYAETTTDGDTVFANWVDSITGATMWLDIEVYDDFGSGISTPGTYAFTEDEASYDTCNLCVIAWSEKQTENGWVEKAYMPVPNTGSMKITDITVVNDPSHGSNPIGKVFAGSMDVVMREVTIDPTTWVATPVNNGCLGRLAYSWSDTIEKPEDSSCTTTPPAGSIQQCSACFGEKGMSESFGGDWQDGDGFVVVNSWVNSRVNPTQWLDIESYITGGGPAQPGTYTFTDQDASYKTCSLCVLAVLEYQSPAGWVEKAFMPAPGTSGQAVITSIDTKPNPTGNFAGSLDVMMREVNIDEKTGETTPVQGGCSGKLVFHWDTPTKCLSGNPSAKEICTNKIDDDGDSFADCLDSDCKNDAACQAPPKENCTNEIDDDGDLKIDCADGDCSDRAICGQGGGGCGVPGEQPSSPSLLWLLGFVLLKRPRRRNG